MPSRTIRGRVRAGTGGLPTPPALILAALLAATSGCSATSGSTTPTATPSSGTVTLDEHARRGSVHLRTGTALVVRLHSTYWSTPTSSDPEVLVPDGGGSSPSGTCPPGGGCGVSSARFTAARPGVVRVTAHRSSCGEAMRCSPGQADYEVTVTVR